MQNKEQEELLMYFQISCNTASVFGASFIIVVFLTLKKLQLFALKIVFYVSMSDLLLGLNMLMIPDTKSLDHGNPLCQIQAFIQSWSGLSSILWTSTMAYSLKYSIIDQKIDLQKKLPFMFFVNFGVSFALSLIDIEKQQILDHHI